MTEQAQATENLHGFIKRRLREIGMYDKDSDYDGMIGEAVEALSATFTGQGHSGMSAAVTRGLFNKLMNEWDSGIAPKPKSSEAEGTPR